MLATRERRELLHVYRKAVEAHTAASNTLKGYLNGNTIRLGRRSLSQEDARMDRGTARLDPLQSECWANTSTIWTPAKNAAAPLPAHRAEIAPSR